MAILFWIARESRIQRSHSFQDWTWLAKEALVGVQYGGDRSQTDHPRMMVARELRAWRGGSSSSWGSRLHKGDHHAEDFDQGHRPPA